jgi:hypothetical protein
MGCVERPNRRDCQDFPFVGARNRHLALILVMSCPHRAERRLLHVYRVLVSRNTWKPCRSIESEQRSSLAAEQGLAIHNGEQELQTPSVEQDVDWASSGPSPEHIVHGSVCDYYLAK